MVKILVTGGAGFIGSALAEKLIREKNNYVVIVDDLSTGHLGKLPNLPKDNWRFIKCDINVYEDIAPIMTSYQFDYVFHFTNIAGISIVQQYLHGLMRYERWCCAVYGTYFSQNMADKQGQVFPAFEQHG